MSHQPTLGLIGSGNIGGALARLAIDAGLNVVLSNSRGPETLADLVAELGPRARAGTPAEAAAAGDWVVVTIPLKHYRQIPVAPLAGKVVLDTTNYYPDRDGSIAGTGRRTGHDQRAPPAAPARQQDRQGVQQHLGQPPGPLARPAGSPDRSVLPIAGDTAEAKAAATRLLDLIGFDALDTGSLADSWRFQRDAPAYVGLYFKDPAEMTMEDPGGPTSAERRAALAAAQRPNA